MKKDSVHKTREKRESWIWKAYTKTYTHTKAYDSDHMLWNRNILFFPPLLLICAVVMLLILDIRSTWNNYKTFFVFVLLVLLHSLLMWIPFVCVGWVYVFRFVHFHSFIKGEHSHHIIRLNRAHKTHRTRNTIYNIRSFWLWLVNSCMRNFVCVCVRAYQMASRRGAFKMYAFAFFTWN